MSSNDFLFGVTPYAVVLLAVVVGIARFRSAPFSVSSLSSQLLESRKLYWGSIPFHWGIVLVLAGHLVALIVPQSFVVWNRVPVRLYLLEFTGFALGLWAAFGIAVLIVRRLTTPRVRRVTSPMDLVVLVVVAIQIITGLWTAIGYRWGSYWGTGVAVPYMRSLFRLSPEVAYMEPLPWPVKLHVLSFFAFIAVFSFSRLVHIVTLPLQYLVRPWQKVVANRDRPDREHVTNDPRVKQLR